MTRRRPDLDVASDEDAFDELAVLDVDGVVVPEPVLVDLEPRRAAPVAIVPISPAAPVMIATFSSSLPMVNLPFVDGVNRLASWPLARALSTGLMSRPWNEVNGYAVRRRVIQA